MSGTILLSMFTENPYPIEYGSEYASGIDLPIPSSILVPANRTVLKVGLKIHIQIPQGYEGQIRLRSSIGKLGLIIPNSPGTIDSDYRGELCLLLMNCGIYDHSLPAGARVAQLIISPVARCQLSKVTFKELSQTKRGENGFGSTGL